MGRFDPKRARREEREHRKQKRLQRILPLVRLEEDVQQQDHMNMYRTHATPPGWIFGCSEVEQGDTGAGVLLPSSRARDLCACSVLTPWAWCWACDGGEPTPMSKTLSGGELVRCQDCRTVRCTANSKLWLCVLQHQRYLTIASCYLAIVIEYLTVYYLTVYISRRTSRESPLYPEGIAPELILWDVGSVLWDACGL